MKGFGYLTAVVLAVIAIGIGVSATDWSQNLSQFTNQDLRFSYPSSWTADTYQEVSSFSSAEVFLSNEAMHAPCVTVTNGFTCSPPVNGLGSDGVFVEWDEFGFPQWTLAREHGKTVTVDGHPGKEAIFSGRGSCVSGTQQGVTLVIARTVPDNFYAMTACLRGPDLVRERAEVDAMVASTRIVEP